MEFVLLADRPRALATVAAWYLEQWGPLSPGETVASMSVKLQKYLNRDRIPLIVLAIEDDEVVGAAQLKLREMDIYPEKEHWLGGVFVSPRHRGRQIGSRLAGKIAEIPLA